MDIFVYPHLLPKIWTSQNSIWIEQTGYIFYIVIFAAIASAAIGLIRLLILYNPLYRSIDNYDNMLASIVTTILSTQPSPSSLTSPSAARNEIITNGHGYAITKRKSSSIENDGNSDDNNNSSAMTNCEKKLRKSLSLSYWPVLIQLA